MAVTSFTLPTSGTNTGSGNNWTNPSNITLDDGSSASISSTSKDLLGSAYGFSIPSGATINGIEVEVKGQNPDGSLTQTFYVYKGGSRAPTTFTGSFGVGSPSVVTKGDSNELWGTTWTDTDINASNFGAAVSVSSSGDGSSVDYIKIRVYYSVVGGNQGIMF